MTLAGPLRARETAVAKKVKSVSLSLGRISDAITSLETDVRKAKDLSAFERKKILALLAALDALVRCFCMKDRKDSDFIVAGTSE